MRKATAFRGGANKTALPCFPKAINRYLTTVPVEQLQRKCFTENPALRKNGLSHPAKGGSTPAFACQRAAIAAGKTILKNKFSPQMWATRPHLGSIFEKLLHRKTF